MPRSLAQAAFDKTVRAGYISVRDRLVHAVFDRRYGVRTMGIVELEELGLAGRDRERYKATGWLTLPRILRRREVSRDDVFIDLGSGMGRVVFQAAHLYPFSRVIGVELSERLNEIARENIERNRDRLRCRDVQLVTADLLEYEIPDDVTVIFMASPLKGAQFAAMIDKLIASFDRNPRPLRVIYHCPREHRLLLETGRLRPLKMLRGMRPGVRWSQENSTRMYAVVPASAGAGQAGGRAGGESTAYV